MSVRLLLRLERSSEVLLVQLAGVLETVETCPISAQIIICADNNMLSYCVYGDPIGGDRHS